MRRFFFEGRKNKAVHLVIFLLFVTIKGGCQFFKTPEYVIEAGVLTGMGRQAPFWLVSNQYGKYCSSLSCGFLSAGIHSGADTEKKIGLGYGFEIYDRLDSRNTLDIQQANISLKLWFMHLRLGSKEESYGNQDSCLSSGSLLWSENTRPMPKLLIATNGYVDVPFTQGYAQFSGLLSHGWFGDDGFVKNAYLHHKNVYIKAGGRLPVNFSMGLQHYAIWGGTSPVPEIGKLPSDFSAFKNVFFSKHNEVNDSGVPQNEALNKIGNHLGSWNYALDIKFNKYLAGIYYQTIFEDYSGFSKFFMKDGLWGIYLKTKNTSEFVNSLVYEYVHTTFQSGPPPANPNQFTQGNDNFFNNSVYASGWTYIGNVIGSPLFSSSELLNSSSISIINNQFIAHHFGMKGRINEHLQYRLLFTASKNYGTYSIPFPETVKVQSLLAEVTKSLQKFKGLDVTAKLGLDHGKLYGNNAAVYLAVRKTGRLFK